MNCRVPLSPPVSRYHVPDMDKPSLQPQRQGGRRAAVTGCPASGHPASPAHHPFQVASHVSPVFSHSAEAISLND